MTHISVIVPAFNSGQTLGACLKAIRDSRFKDYELIVVDDGSRDDTSLIARKYADEVIILNERKGRSCARQTAIRAAAGEIIVNVDSDILIPPDTLSRIRDLFTRRPGIKALTGLLSKEHPNPDFFSQYKNLYMHYIFRKLPERVTFLYGSIYALRRECAVSNVPEDLAMGEDTELGQKLFFSGNEIAFMKDLEVVHLKKYGFLSFLKNDLLIPFNWALIFMRHSGWKQLFKNRTGFAHSPKEQLVSVVLAPVCAVAGLLSLWYPDALWICAGLFLTWSVLNAGFIGFLAKERGLLFGCAAVLITFLDHLTMAAGILWGACAAFMKKPFSRRF